ncbi:hypothetical protein JCGZ_15202 [Jatropha curcas]|uniref:Uncharacterized protein n=1 Tax=Jatropha curcas TaxID=180498 RepID=A0A067K5Y9_JATCU|nr:hypothetical protein JCGZ_15202 [Jatropha curcas]
MDKTLALSRYQVFRFRQRSAKLVNRLCVIGPLSKPWVLGTLYHTILTADPVWEIGHGTVKTGVQHIIKVHAPSSDQSNPPPKTTPPNHRIIPEIKVSSGPGPKIGRAIVRDEPRQETMIRLPVFEIFQPGELVHGVNLPQVVRNGLDEK